MNRLIAAYLVLTLSACTTSPTDNMIAGALIGAGEGAAMGALMTFPCFGCGAPLGALAGAVMGSAAGLASTTAAPMMDHYYPGYPYP